MLGVVTTLAEPHREQVLQLWQELKTRFGVDHPGDFCIPHFSFHIAPDYDIEALKQILVDTAVSTPPFTLRTTGIGIFSGENPVVYLPISRTPQLQTLHSNLWARLPNIAHGEAPVSSYYNAFNWFPHVSLGQSNITAENLGPIVTWLNSQPLHWEIHVNNLTFMQADGNRHISLYQAKLESGY